MKRYLYLLTIVFIVCTSCSNNTDNLNFNLKKSATQPNSIMPLSDGNYYIYHVINYDLTGNILKESDSPQFIIVDKGMLPSFGNDKDGHYQEPYLKSYHFLSTLSPFFGDYFHYFKIDSLGIFGEPLGIGIAFEKNAPYMLSESNAKALKLPNYPKGYKEKCSVYSIDIFEQNGDFKLTCDLYFGKGYGLVYFKEYFDKGRTKVKCESYLIDCSIQ